MKRRRILILGTCCLSLFMVGLDNTIVNLALPSIGQSLDATISGLQWTIDAYTLVLASLLIAAGSMADRVGRRRIFQAGLAIFIGGSLLCSLAPTINLLVAFRVVQAIGGSMLNPVAMSIIRNTFHNPRERAQAIGVWGSVIGVSMALGPVAGGVLVHDMGWRSIFWVNVPIGLLALLLTARFVPESRAQRPRPVDLWAQVLLFVALASLTSAMIEGPLLKWFSTPTLGLFATTFLSVLVLLWHERRRTLPLLELRFFRSAPFTGANLIAALSYAALGSFLFLNSLYLQEVRGLSALQAGIATLPMAAMTMISALISGQIISRFGVRGPLFFGGAAMLVASILLVDANAQTSLIRLQLAYSLFGAGFGSVNPPINNTAVSGMPPTQAGLAAATASASRQVGQTFGVAVLGVASTAAFHRGRLGVDAATATPTGWWIIAACALCLLAVAAATTNRWAIGTAARVAETLPTLD